MAVRHVASVTEEYWDWVAVALFLLLTVDMLTSMFAAAAVGSDAEANPFMQWAIEQGVLTLLVVNLVVLVLVVLMFYGLQESLDLVPEPYYWYVALVVDVWLALLVIAGLVIFTNNLAVIVLEQSLL